MVAAPPASGRPTPFAEKLQGKVKDTHKATTKNKHIHTHTPNLRMVAGERAIEACDLHRRKQDSSRPYEEMGTQGDKKGREAQHNRLILFG